MENGEALTTNPEQEERASLIEQIKQLKNPDYVEAIGDDSIKSWIQRGQTSVYVMCFSEAVDGGTWWGDELTGVDYEYLPSDEIERNECFIGMVHRRLDDDERDLFLQKFAAARVDANMKREAHENSRSSPDSRPLSALGQTEQNDNNVEIGDEEAALILNLAYELELSPETVRDMQLYQLGEPVLSVEHNVYLHGLKNSQNGISLAIKYELDSQRWLCALLTEGERQTFKHYHGQANAPAEDDGNQHWLLQISASWRRLDAGQIQQLIRSKLEDQYGQIVA